MKEFYQLSEWNAIVNKKMCQLSKSNNKAYIPQAKGQKFLFFKIL